MLPMRSLFKSAHISYLMVVTSDKQCVGAINIGAQLTFLRVTLVKLVASCRIMVTKLSLLTSVCCAILYDVPTNAPR